MSELYHLFYEKRYKKVYEAGADYWGHTPDDEELSETLAKWVKQHDLKGKKVIEFFCGEGASGVILSKLGCIYHGVDISPTALKKAENSLKDYPNAKVMEINVVSGKIGSTYNAALDVMGFHMLVTDPDRKAYLRNAISCLENKSPMLFFRQMCMEDSNDDFINSYDDWLTISGGDYTTPRKMNFIKDGEEIEVEIPYVTGRSKTETGYTQELLEAGFSIDSVVQEPQSRKCPDSISIYAHKPE